MRYAPTVFGKMDWGRAKTAEGTFQLKELIPRRTGTFYLQKFLPRRTGTFWCCKLKRLVVPVLFGVANRNGSSYWYFLVLQTEMARRTGTFCCCKLKQLVVPVLFDEYFYNVKTYRYFCYKKLHLLNDMCIFLKAYFVGPKQCLA